MDDTQPIEVTFPHTFRQKDVEQLGMHLKHHNSVTLMGMKRVGINNFLHFFFSNPEIANTYLTNGVTHFPITIDLNDLVEREIFAFWTLTLKRIVDTIEDSPLTTSLVETSLKRFTDSIQLKDLFFTVDTVRKLMSALVKANLYPTLIFNRFDRMKDAATPEFFSNLQSLKDHAKRQLSFVFTSYRPLYELRSDVFQKAALAVFCHDMYLKPATTKDAQAMLDTFITRYQLKLSKHHQSAILEIAGGHAQYIQLAALKLRDTPQEIKTNTQLLELLTNSEEATLQSEELFESLTKAEQDALLTHAKEMPQYLKDTGVIDSNGQIFSQLFATYVEKQSVSKTLTPPSDFTKKEHLLYTYLMNNEGQLCEREAIIEAVWPDYAESGVSDWAIDRLVARVRSKMKAQNSPYEIVTVITRGYKMVKKS